MNREREGSCDSASGQTWSSPPSLWRLLIATQFVRYSAFDQMLLQKVLLLLLISISLCIAEDKAILLVKKSVLNDEVVVLRDAVVTVRIFNVGTR